MFYLTLEMYESRTKKDLLLIMVSVWPLQKLEERFRISRRELISFEFTILVALEMALYLPESKVLPHYRRLVQQV